MLNYLVHRILIMIPTLIAISIVIFTIINLPQGNYFTTYIAELQESGEPADLAKIHFLEAEYGFDRPLWEQYLYWVGGLLRGDLGYSFSYNLPVAKVVGDRLYLLFDWDNGARRGLIDAHREGTRLVGKYINLTDPKITRPWIGLIVSNQRIDGRWSGGRLDFRR